MHLRRESIPLLDETTCDCKDYYDQEWTRHPPYPQPAVAPPQTALEQAARDVVTWFEVQRPDLIGPKIERLRALLPPIDWRDAITVIPISESAVEETKS